MKFMKTQRELFSLCAVFSTMVLFPAVCPQNASGIVTSTVSSSVNSTDAETDAASETGAGKSTVTSNTSLSESKGAGSLETNTGTSHSNASMTGQQHAGTTQTSMTEQQTGKPQNSTLGQQWSETTETGRQQLDFTPPSQEGTMTDTQTSSNNNSVSVTFVETSLNETDDLNSTSIPLSLQTIIPRQELIPAPMEGETPTPSFQPDFPLLQNLTATSVSESLPDPGPPPDTVFSVTHVEPSPFERVAQIFPDFERQVVALHAEVCGTNCHFVYENSKGSKSRGCAKCFCDHLCHVYGDCCPDVQLLNQSAVTGNDTKKLTPHKNVYTCEKSHLKAASLNNQFYSMVNYCPYNNTSRRSDDMENDSSNLANNQNGSLDETRAMLERQCENRENSSHWHYTRPLTSSMGVVYGNQFCAQCHGQDRQSLTAWSISVMCNADLLHSATSAREAYFLAVNTPDCDVLFRSSQHEALRECSYVNHPIISSCNVTGLWRRYDARVERACASFIAPVFRKYRNVFCYFCNDNIMPFEHLSFYLDQGDDSSYIGRVSFYALLDVDEDNDDGSSSVESTVDGNATSTECEIGTIRDPLYAQCDCRPVRCGEGLRVEDNTCSQVIAQTNYFGFYVCSRVHIHANGPASLNVLHSGVFFAIAHSSADVSLWLAEAHPMVDCSNNSKMTLDVNFKFYSVKSMPMREMADKIVTSLRRAVDQYSDYSAANISIVISAAHCVSHRLYPPDTCTTKNDTIAMNSLVYWGPVLQGLDLSKLSLATLYNTTFCPHVNLSEAEFRNFSEILSLSNLTEANITMDIISTDNSTFYLICQEDYLRVAAITDKCRQDVSGPGISPASQGFQDSWTTIGLTSTVCTCVSLVCLLAVIVIYSLLPPLRAGSGRSTLAMTCVLFVAQAMFEVGVEQFEWYWLCLTLALLIHFFWLSAVFMMTCCTLQLFVSIRYPLKARTHLSTNKMLIASLMSSFGLSAAIVCMTLLGNHLVYGDLGYPASYLCFIRRPLSRQLGFGFPLGLAVLFNVLLFLLTIIHIRTRPRVSSTRQDQVSLMACFRLSLMTGVCWLALFLMAVPGTRPWLEYVFVALLALQGLLLATTLLLNKRVYNLLKQHFSQGKKSSSKRKIVKHSSSNDGSKTDSSSKYTVTTSDSSSKPQ